MKKRRSRILRSVTGGFLVLLALAAAAVVLMAFGCGYIWLPGGWIINLPGSEGDPMPERLLRERIALPEGFSINTYARGIENARLLRFTSAGDLLVSAPRQGKVFLVSRDADGDGRGDGVRVLIGELDRPHGLALFEHWLYVAETDAVLRLIFDEDEGAVTGERQYVVRGLPGGGQHWTRTIGIGPDRGLYVSIGSSCNACIEEDPRRAAISRYELEGSNEWIYATGLRNAVGFAWQPETGDLYATDNGRDLLGDDFPPDELNRIVPGGFYGWPFANGNRVPDPDYGEGNAELIAQSIPPVHRFAAHVAALGITFHTGEGFPKRYQGAAFVALHGSWNRSRKIGYEVVALHFRPDGSVEEEKFATGFEIDEEVYGRPVDVAVGPDGALYVSDDYTGSVYRIAYGAPARGEAPAAPVAESRTGVAAEMPQSEAEQQAFARGEQLWEAHRCAQCHAEGERTATNVPLRNLGEKYTVESLAHYLQAPQPPMPVFPLTERQRRDLAVYLLATFP